MNSEVYDDLESRWLATRLEEIESTPGHVIVDDPDGVVPVTSGWSMVADWWELRRAYELHGRRSARSVIVVRPPLAGESLPFDIERGASVVRARLPGPADVRAVLALMAGQSLDRAISAVEHAPDPARALVEHLAGVRLPPGTAPLPDQIRIVGRLRSRAPASAIKLATPWIAEPVLRAVVDEPTASPVLQERFESALLGTDARWASAFDAAQDDVAALVASGLIRPVVVSGAPPTWAGPGVASPTAGDRAQSLLEHPRPIPTTHVEWHDCARWWASVRRKVALAADRDLAARAWDWWDTVDASFSSWLQENYGSTLSSSAPWPAAVHRVADLLWRRLQSAAERVAVVVLDGMGLTQWEHVVERASLELEDDGTTMALVPTWTSVSRQAIAAGDLPTTFRTLWETADERKSWQRYWTSRGLRSHEAMHRVVAGRGVADRVDLGVARAAMVVVSAPDELMHTAELLGDAQVLAGLDAWVNSGWLADFLLRARDGAVEVWITADHGNVQCLPAGAPRTGLSADAAGKRLLRFRTSVDRTTSGTDGVDWDGIPGLPPDAPALRFARGRTAYTNLPISVSHGGLSLDEVIVPLARVAT